MTEPNPADGSIPLVTTYAYNRTDQVTQVLMPRGMTQTRTFTYDLLTKLTSETHPETGTTQYTYRAGNHGGVLLESKTDAKGQKTLFENYDQYNRLGRKRFFNASHGEDVCQQVNYTYDAYTAAMGTNLGGGWGRLTSSRVGPGDNTAACAVVSQYSGGLVDPVELAMLLAPQEDEPESAEERAAVVAALSDPSPDMLLNN